MPKGPNGEKRPADAIARAVMVAKIATGEIDEDRAPTITDRAKAGAHGRAAKLSAARRSKIASKAAAARWKTAERQDEDL